MLKLNQINKNIIFNTHILFLATNIPYSKLVDPIIYISVTNWQLCAKKTYLKSTLAPSILPPMNCDSDIDISSTKHGIN